MTKISDQEFADFLATKPLYYKIKAVENLTGYNSGAFIDHHEFKDKPFKFLCPYENEVQTFRTGYGEKVHIARFLLQVEKTIASCLTLLTTKQENWILNCMFMVSVNPVNRQFIF